MENISCLDNVVEFILRTENFSPDDIEEALLFDNCTGQTIGSTKFTNNDIHKNEFSDMTKAVMESVPYEDVILYSADILSVPSFSSNYKKMDQGQQINQEPFDPADLFEFSDEEFRQMINLRDSFDVQEEVVIEECPKQDIFIQSFDMNYSTVFDIILQTEAEYRSSTSIVDIPISEGEAASYSVNPYELSRFNQKSHIINHMLTNHTEHPSCCVLCSNHYNRKSDLTKHMKILKGPNNVSDSSQFTVPIHSQSITNGKGSENKSDTYQEQNTKKGNGRGKSRNTRKDPLMALKFYSKPHTCNPCGISFTYKKALFKHARFLHNHDDVNIVATQKSNSEKHELTILANSKFNKVSSYSCNLCEAVFNRFDFFKRHQRLHINIELGKIEGETNSCIDCGLLLNSLPELELHTKQHLTVTNFPKVFKNRSSQKIHAWLFNCNYCKKSFADCITLKKQKRIHTGKRTYACSACTKSLIQRVGTFEDQRHTKLGNEKNTCCLVPNAMTGQFDTEQVSYGSKYTDLKSELMPKKQCFVLKDRECTRPCSTILYHSSRSDSTVMNSSLAEESKKNVILIEPDGQISVNYKDLTHIEKKNKQPEFVVQNYNKISNINYTKVKRKYQRRSKFDNQKNTRCLVSNAMAGQFDTDICEDESVPTVDKQYIQSIINEDDMRYNPMSVASPSESQRKTFKIINSKLQKNKQKSSEQESPGSKYTVVKSEHVPKKQSFVLKDGECTRTCSTVLYYYSRSYSSVMNSSLSDESKENDTLIEPEDQKTIK